MNFQRRHNMSRKYYITNGCEFIGREGAIVPSLSEAKRFSFNEGQSFLQGQLKISPNWQMQKLFATGKKYVITTATQFAGRDSITCKYVEKAKQFNSAADASAYIRKHSELQRYISNPIITDDEFDAVDKPLRRTFTEEQLKILGVSADKPAPRTPINKSVKDQVYTESAGICALCGKPMTQWNRTIDHIIPVSKGGGNNKRNIRYVHKNCNQLKGNMLDKDMYNTVSSINAKLIYEQPDSQEALYVMRAYIRGIINQYKNKGW